MTFVQDIESSFEKGSSIVLKDEKVPLLAHKRASFGSSVFNLSCTIVGAGIMSLPAAIKVLGVIPGVILIIIGGFLTEASIEFLIRFSDASCSFSYSSVMEDSFGKIEDVLSGSTTSSGVHHPGVLEDGFGQQWWTRRAFVLFILTQFAFMPLIWCKRIYSLRYTSAVAVALAVLFIVVVIAITAFKLVKELYRSLHGFHLFRALNRFGISSLLYLFLFVHTSATSMVGMTNVSHSYCVTGKILAHLLCYPNMKPCANPEKYLFWDGAHPTRAKLATVSWPPLASMAQIYVFLTISSNLFKRKLILGLFIVQHNKIRIRDLRKVLK